MDSTFPSSSTLALAALGVYGAYCAGTWIYNLYFHPLRHIPGPWYTAISPTWLAIKDMQFKKGTQSSTSYSYLS